MGSKSLNRIPLYIDNTLLGYYHIESNEVSDLASSTLGGLKPSRSTKSNKLPNTIYFALNESYSDILSKSIQET